MTWVRFFSFVNPMKCISQLVHNSTNFRKQLPCLTSLHLIDKKTCKILNSRYVTIIVRTHIRVIYLRVKHVTRD